ncbi:MAG TPA: helix-turn-helix domain-containing protein [Candidatus Binatia bacterium]|nr:helix-turn-helix domain-containing protein [Candidatus Binatia bacterium]
MQSLGNHVRRTRELLGLTQGQLATIAGASQAAVSRLELGSALGTPYLVVLAVQSALCTKLRELTELPATETEGALGHPSMMAELTDARPLPPVVVAEELLRYVAIFNEAPPPLRMQLLAIVEAVATPAAAKSPLP